MEEGSALLMVLLTDSPASVIHTRTHAHITFMYRKASALVQT